MSWSGLMVRDSSSESHWYRYLKHIISYNHSWHHIHPQDCSTPGDGVCMREIKFLQRRKEKKKMFHILKMKRSRNTPFTLLLRVYYAIICASGFIDTFQQRFRSRPHFSRWRMHRSQTRTQWFTSDCTDYMPLLHNVVIGTALQIQWP